MNRAGDEAAITARVTRGSDAVNERDGETYHGCRTDDAVWDQGEPVDQIKPGLAANMAEVKGAGVGVDLFMRMPHPTADLGVNGSCGKARAALHEGGWIEPETTGLPGDTDGMTILAICADKSRREAETKRLTELRYEVLLFDGHAPRFEVATAK